MATRASAIVFSVLLVAAWATAHGAEPAEIPAKLQMQAKKAFAQKKPYFIWTDAALKKAKEVKLYYAANPDLKATDAHTVVKLAYVGNQGRAVPWHGITEGIDESHVVGLGFRPIGQVSVYLIKATDVIDDKGNVNPAPERATPISNVWTLKVAVD
jgi:hypothetical protein